MENIDLSPMINNNPHTSSVRHYSPNTISFHDLEVDSYFYSMLCFHDQYTRYPARWRASEIEGYITSFLMGDVIMPVVLYSGKGKIVIFDGGHRLASLILWRNSFYEKVSRGHLVEGGLRNKGLLYNQLARELMILGNGKTSVSKSVLVRMATLAMPVVWAPNADHFKTVYKNIHCFKEWKKRVGDCTEVRKS